MEGGPFVLVRMGIERRLVAQGAGALRKERCGFAREKAWAPAAKSGVRLSSVGKEQILQRMMRFNGWAAGANMGDWRARLSRKRNT